jgi:histidyl-tRNA synthetase
MNTFQSARGTRDILPPEHRIWNRVRQVAQEVGEQMGYQPITTPMFEEVGVFQRSLGSGTDIIDKELFLISSRHGEEASLALRPEGTAGIVRALIQHGVQTWPQPVRTYSNTNLFRYERPQRGRYREHVQFNSDIFGDFSPFADALVILTQWQILQNLGLTSVKLLINSLGTKEERATYAQQLVAHLDPIKERLSEDSQRRLMVNPLRILDSKDEKDQTLLNEIPSLVESLTEESSARYSDVLHYLTTWSIPFEQNDRLVRGLDYYCHTAFEWVLTSGTSTLSLGGGGRYNGLLPELGGPDIGAVGGGLGLDRIVDALSEHSDLIPVPKPDVVLVAVDVASRHYTASCIPELLNAGIQIRAELEKGSVGAQLKAASRAEAQFVIICGPEEVVANVVILKDLASGEQRTIERSNLLQELQTLLKK